MVYMKMLLLSLLALSSGNARISNKKFPGKDKFMLGVATASYQIEGAWNEDGKAEHIWDRLVHSNSNPVKGNGTGDIACDSYHKVDDDLAMLKELGVDFYRFSISWSRLLPTGSENNVNKYAVDYYNSLIDGLLKHGIKPIVTLFHWDTPQRLEDKGGFTNKIIQDEFLMYAKVCFKLFGDRVKYWTTFNEPKQTCSQGYGTGEKAPLKKSPGLAEYLCVYNVIRSHAKAFHLYEKEFKKAQNGMVGITIDSANMLPANDSNQEDIDAAEKYENFIFGMYANPIVIGDWPKDVKEMVHNRSKAQGFTQSRLPNFTEDEIENNKGTLDFMAVNCYTSNLVKPASTPNPHGRGLEADAEIDAYSSDDWEKTPSDWLRITPWACRNLISWVHKKYNPKQIMITENGIADTGTLDDDKRISFYQKYLTEIQEVMEEVNLIGFTAWSLMDNFEWMNGYTERFGLYQVDFNDPKRKRTPKKSAKWYKNFIKTRCLINNCE